MSDQVRRPDEGRLPQGGRAGRASWIPRRGTEQLDQLEDERQFAADRGRAQGHLPRLEPQDPRGGQASTPTSTSSVRPLPEDADLRGQRPAAHLARRPARRPRRRTSSAAASRSSARSPAASTAHCKRIREFRNRPEPGIVVTVDLLSTGVDIPDLEFIVFLRPVKSRILFEQMLGRGTRKGEKFPDKSHFTVFDCFDGTLLAYFRQATAITAEPPEKPSRTDRRDHRRHLGEPGPRLQHPLPGQAPPAHRQGDGRRGAGRCSRRMASPDGDLGRFATELPAQSAPRLHGHDEAPARRRRSRHLLVNYPRRPRGLHRGRSSTRTTCRPRWLIRDAPGARVQARGLPGRLRAASSARTRPRSRPSASCSTGRRTGAPRPLTELRQKLAAAPERFTVEHLQKAHRARGTTRRSSTSSRW